MKVKTQPVNYKNFDAQIEIISSIGIIGSLPIVIKGYDHCKAELIRKVDDFMLQVDGVFDISTTANEIIAIINDNTYILKTSEAVIRSFKGDALAGISRTQTFDLHTIISPDFSKDTKSKFRCFFSTDVESIKSFCYLFETLRYENDHTRYAFDCVRLKAGDRTYDVIQVKNVNGGYYIIENLDDNNYESFKDDCYAIQQALGFLTGYMPGGEQYLFVNDAFEYSRFVRPALKSFYNPVNSNPYSKLYGDKEAAKLFEGKLTKISSVVFSNLVNLIRENETLSMAIILLMEAASVKSLLLIPSVFAVIIESLAKSISVPEKGKFLPINDPHLSDKIIKELLAVIESNQDSLQDEGALKLKNRIFNINQPVIKEKLTNNEKLTQPFEQLGIKLSLEDLMAIEHRNDLLHGNISLDNDACRSAKVSNGYMMHIMDRLYTLISKLLLKCAGYEGYIINYAKFSEVGAGVETVEGHFVEI